MSFIKIREYANYQAQTILDDHKDHNDHKENAYGNVSISDNFSQISNCKRWNIIETMK